MSFGSAAGLNGAPFVESSVTGMQVSDVMTTQTVADQVVAKFLGVVDGYALTFTVWVSNLVDCTNKYRLIPAATTSRVPVIWIHGWQLLYPTCPLWNGAGFPILDAFLPGDQGTTFYNNWNTSLLTAADFYRFTYPTFASVDAAAARLADNLKTYVNPARPAIIVGHSMGGLVARAAVERHGAAPYVRSIITLGTPHRGSPLADPGFITDLARKSGVLGACAAAFANCPAAFQTGTEVLDDALQTAGAQDLRPSSTFLSLLAILPDIHYSFLDGQWGIGASNPPYPCWGYGVKCFAAWIGETAMRVDGVQMSDGVVPSASAQNNGVNNVDDFLSIGGGISPVHHFALADGVPEGNAHDLLFAEVVALIRYQIGLCVSLVVCEGLQPAAATGPGIVRAFDNTTSLVTRPTMTIRSRRTQRIVGPSSDWPQGSPPRRSPVPD